MENADACSDALDSSDKPPPECSPPTSTISAATAAVDATDLPDWVSKAQWNDWTWQLRSRIRSLDQLAKRFPGLLVTSGMAEATKRFPLAVTPYYASLIRNLDRSDPIFQMCVPQPEELYDPPCLMDDPLGEDEHMPVPGLVHRYADRALLLATTACSTYCRHCTRKRVAGQQEVALSAGRLAQAVEYLSVHPEVHDVVISGGDPFTMSTAALERVIAAVRSVRSVEIIRLGTRTPVVLPMRITAELANMLRRFQPIYVNTHFNHPTELTPDAAAACQRLADAGIPVGNQTVLLRGVNDEARLLADLFRALVRNRVRPYYLFQCDLVRGVEHFRTPLARGIEIMEYLRGRLSGLAIPTFVVDAPHGGGKIPVLPNYVVSVSPSHTVLRNYQGVMVAYPEPAEITGVGSATPPPDAMPGVWELASGLRSGVPPQRIGRRQKKRERTACGVGRDLLSQLELRLSAN